MYTWCLPVSLQLQWLMMAFLNHCVQLLCVLQTMATETEQIMLEVNALKLLQSWKERQRHSRGCPLLSSMTLGYADILTELNINLNLSCLFFFVDYFWFLYSLNIWLAKTINVLRENKDTLKTDGRVSTLKPIKKCLHMKWSNIMSSTRKASYFSWVKNLRV